MWWFSGAVALCGGATLAIEQVWLISSTAQSTHASALVHPVILEQLQAGSHLGETFKFVNGFVLKGPDAQRYTASLQNTRGLTVEVDRVEQAGMVRRTQRGVSWAMSRIARGGPVRFDRPRAVLEPLTYSWTYNEDASGLGVTIYVLDTKVDPQIEDLQGRVRQVQVEDDAVGGRGHFGPYARHGATMAALAAGRIWGVAKHARIVSIAVMDGYTAMGPLDGVRGIEAALEDISRRREPAIMCGCWGLSRAVILDHAADQTTAARVPFLVAAGNLNEPAEMLSPQHSQSVFTVAGSTPTDQMMSWSNWGPTVDAIAPGHSIVVPLFDERGPRWTIDSGTSLSNALAVGIAASWLSQPPSQQWSQEHFYAWLRASGEHGALTHMAHNTPNILLRIRPGFELSNETLQMPADSDTGSSGIV
ncbi:hypothetical protein PYCC9005_002572 [Savitreella phatthalungensis]